jgi:hypothetical protein
LDNSCNDKKDTNGEGGNEGDINFQFDADLKMSAHELGKGNISVAEKISVDDCDGQLEEHSKAICATAAISQVQNKKIKFKIICSILKFYFNIYQI